MQNVSFSPRGPEERDLVAIALGKIARNILVVVLGLTPLFFVPAVYAPFNFSKVFFVILGVCIAIIFYNLSVLRAGTLEIRLLAGWVSAWTLAGVIFVAALFSGDLRDSLLGDGYEVQSAVFVGLLALIVSAVTILREKKTSIMRIYVLLTGVGLLIGLYHLVRLVFGADVLTFGIFTGSTSTPLGGWNDLAIFFGLSLLLALVAVEQFPLTKWGKVLFGAMSAISLVMLAVVNFFAIWVVLGLMSLIVMIYSLTKNRFRHHNPTSQADDNSNTLASIILSVIVFIVSMIFISGGSGIGQVVSNLTGVSYVEVRPSVSATLDITRAAYGDNMFFGVGPNRFIDAWRLYKDPAINQTIFWNSPFESGVGYIPTFAITSGIFGLIAWLVFFFFVLRAGFRVLFKSTPSDRFWYFAGASSFVSALYLWGMSVIYVPGPAILILAAVFTGILFSSQAAMQPGDSIKLSIAQNRQHGFAMVAVAIIIIVSSVAALYFTGRQYSALLSFNQALTSVTAGTPVEKIETGISDSYQLSNNDRFAREIVGLQIQKINTLLGVSEPTDAERQQFQASIVNAINAGQLAVNLDPTEPRNWQSLGAIYSVLAASGVEGAADRSREAFNAALQYDPQNPELTLQKAQLESRIGNLNGAIELAQQAVALKPNYSEAYFFISQAQVASGNVPAAIESTIANITLEPRNPARYYQLGVLYTANGEIPEAAAAFESAITLDQNYANAGYFLALAYDQLGRPADALAQLERVLELNPGNEAVSALIGQLERGESLGRASASVEQIPEPEAEIGEDGEVLSPEDTDSPLISPVNIVPAENSEEVESKADEALRTEGISSEGVETETNAATE